MGITNEALLAIKVMFIGADKELSKLKTQTANALSTSEKKSLKLSSKVMDAKIKNERLLQKEMFKGYADKERATERSINMLRNQSRNIVRNFSDLKGIGQTGQDLKKMAVNGIDTSQAMKMLRANFVKLNSSMGNTFKNVKDVDRQFNKLIRSQKRFNFDFLTLLFAGMMLKRVFGGALKSIISHYKKITGMNSQFNRTVLKLGASWSYLKFAIGNALNSPSVIGVIEWFIRRVEWLGDVMAENKGLSLLIVSVVTALATVGTLAMITSGVMQVGMMAKALEKLARSIADGGLARGLTSVTGKISTLVNSAGFKTLFGVGLTAYAAFEFVKSLDSRTPTSNGNILKTAIAAGFGTALLFNPITGIVTGLVILATMAIDKIDKIRLKGLAEQAQRDFQVFINDAARNQTLIDLKLFESQAEQAAYKMGGPFVDAINKIKKDWKAGAIFDEAQYKQKLTAALQVVNIEASDATQKMVALKKAEEEWSTASKHYGYGKNLKLELTPGSENNQGSDTIVDTILGRGATGSIDVYETALVDLADNTVEAVKKTIPPLEQHKEKIKELQAQLDDYEVKELFSNIDLAKLKEFKDEMILIKEPLATFVFLLNDPENSLYTALFKITGILNVDGNIVDKFGTFNGLINNGNVILPKHTKYVNTEAIAMNSLAAATNAAASAQERLNAAKAEKNRQRSIVDKVVDTVSTIFGGGDD